ncbi:GNAT family N-acetyltransferase [Salipiger sp. IMCC34102]|uniref:GNAT family N-acetyltransferase n=1 Tax=Salipiger sp. IMCC34102 TaxID=2510647 RepID=UPI00101C9C07|nr:GNAT family N-acyltransferase [Salipiger sp. IMCC34102]RYH03110.1 GNAT family N-acetyltransferase [Salipiger sp. IMCC34102]
MSASTVQLSHRLARSAADLDRVQRLRYDVFVRELQADGPLVDHPGGRERDAFDDRADHLMLLDGMGTLIGTSRIMDARQAAAAGGFSSAAEFDLAPLTDSGLELLELSRTCLHPDWRGGIALHRLWEGVGTCVRARGARVLFGAASFRGTDRTRLEAPVALLQARHPGPRDLRPKAHGPGHWVPGPYEGDTKAALRQVPSLIKAYLRLGGGVGIGACPDPAFRTTDVCMVLNVARIPPERAARFGGAA